MKYFVIATICLFFLFSCQENNPKKEENNPNKALITDFFQHFNRHDWAKMAAMYADSAEFKDPSFGTEAIKQTQQQVIQKYSELAKQIPDIQDNIQQIYVSGEKHVIVEFVSTGTAPDKSTFSLPICTVFTIENGKITKDYTYYDNE